jgi:hypothetical protein
LGQDRIVVPVFGRFEDPGVTATDESGVPPVISQSPLFINTNATGETVITYTATDGSGNSASVQRTVAVGDFIAPTIQLIGPSAISVERGSWLSEIDPGVLVSDNYDSPQDITILIDSTDYNKEDAGVYFITYRAMDRSGNKSLEVIRQVQLTFATGLASRLGANSQLRVYPNPTGGNFTIIAFGIAGSKLMIYDQVGRLVKSQDITADNQPVDATQLAKGVYLLKIMTEDGERYGKVQITN